MRLALTAFLVICGCAGFAAEKNVAAKPINTVCPVDGKAVDTKGSFVAAKDANDKPIIIGTCSDACTQTVKADPQAYVPAAVANKKKD
ncbi:MAG: hypothetical protein H0W83_15760 [Planctomycetes bacterium]|nr:hypothetical protein [Planctomycetota bacterium]